MKKRILLLAILGLFLFYSFSSVVSAQSPYQTQTIPITINSSGQFSGDAQNVGVSFYVRGTAGATGSVTTQIYNSNPQPTASIPDGISLAHFTAITFNINPNEFTEAIVYITYSDADVANLHAPYNVYEYTSDGYVMLTSSVNTATKVITVILDSPDDALFAIGGTNIEDNGDGFSATAWAALAAAIVIIVVLVVVGVWYFKKHAK